MFSIFHNVDGEKVSTFNTEIEFIDFMKRIVIENEDFDISIISLSDALEYLENCCPNLTLLN